MSYCRWSSDNMKSDVYAYEDCVGGYTVHIRSKHPINTEILPEFPTEAFKQRDTAAIREWLDKERNAYEYLIYEDIGLEFDGETISVDNLEDLHGTLVYLRDIGYHVPGSALEMIEEEIGDETL